MFKPNFRYTDKIVGDLTQIVAARELVLNSPFIPKWEDYEQGHKKFV